METKKTRRLGVYKEGGKEYLRPAKEFVKPATKSPYSHLDFIEQQILRYLFVYGGWVTSNQVADELRIAWVTADKHLKILHRLGYVIKGQSQAGRTYWRANL